MAKKRKRRTRDEARNREADRAKAAGLPPLANVQVREASGRIARHVSDGYARDDARDSLMARARHLGWLDGKEDPTKPEDRRKIADALKRAQSAGLEGEAGAAISIAAANPDAARKLRNTWNGFSSARLAFHRRILGIGPQISALQLHVASTTQLPDDYKPDLRTEDEVIADVRRAWAFWAERLRELPPSRADALRNAVSDTTIFARDGQLTAAGAEFVMSLAALSALSKQ